jgi:hypothetical protein
MPNDLEVRMSLDESSRAHAPPAQEIVLKVRENSNGYWYIGAGISIADGPFRSPRKLLTVASDLLAAETRWRIEVFNAAGTQVVSYSSADLAANELIATRFGDRWRTLPNAANHGVANGGGVAAPA